MAVCDNWHHCECSGIVEEMDYELEGLIKVLEKLADAQSDALNATLLAIKKAKEMQQ